MQLAIQAAAESNSVARNYLRDTRQSTSVLLGEQSASKTDGPGSNPGGPAERNVPAWQSGDAAVL